MIGAISILCLIVMLVRSGLFTFGLIVTLLIRASSVFCLIVTLVISALYVRLIVTFVISALYFLFDCYVSDKRALFSV